MLVACKLKHLLKQTHGPASVAILLHDRLDQSPLCRHPLQLHTTFSVYIHSVSTNATSYIYVPRMCCCSRHMQRAIAFQVHIHHTLSYLLCKRQYQQVCHWTDWNCQNLHVHIQLLPVKGDDTPENSVRHTDEILENTALSYLTL